MLPPSTVTCCIRLSEAHKRAYQSDLLTSEHTYKRRYTRLVLCSNQFLGIPTGTQFYLRHYEANRRQWSRSDNGRQKKS